MMIDPGSIGRTGLGATKGGDWMIGAGSTGAGSAQVGAEVPFRVFKTRSTLRPEEEGRSGCWGIGSAVGISEVGAVTVVDSFSSEAGGSGRHSRLDFWQVGHTQSRELRMRTVE